MKDKSIALKIVICASVYLIFSLSILFAVYSLALFGIALILGAIYGIFVAVITISGTTRETIIARVLGILSAFIAQFILSSSGIPYRIIMFLLRDDEFVREYSRLSITQMIGYFFGIIAFWQIAIPLFVVSIIVIFVIGKRRKKSSSQVAREL